MCPQVYASAGNGWDRRREGNARGAPRFGKAVSRPRAGSVNETRAPPACARLGPDPAALGLDEAAGDREAEARAAACRGARSPRQKRSNIRRARLGGRGRSPVSSTRDADVVVGGVRASPRRRRRTGVWRRAFVSRLRSTRSTFSGAQRRVGRLRRAARSSVTSAGARLGLEAAHARLDERRDATIRCSSRVSAPASIRASSKRSSTSAASRRACSRSGAQVLVGLGEPVLDRLEHRLIEAIGVRRSWLAQATSSRRASKSSRGSAAIALNERPSSASSRGPPVGRARA